MTGIVLKVLILSALLSIAIKYGGPLLPVSGTNTAALIGVCLPAGAMAMALAWRWGQVGSRE